MILRHASFFNSGSGFEEYTFYCLLNGKQSCTEVGGLALGFGDSFCFGFVWFECVCVLVMGFGFFFFCWVFYYDVTQLIWRNYKKPK